MSVILKNVEAPLDLVSPFGAITTQIYLTLWESAQMDNRGDCGGLTSWTHLGLSKELGFTRRTVERHINILLDEGFITVAGSNRSNRGKKSRVYRVIHPDHISTQKMILSFYAKPASVRWAEWSKGVATVDIGDGPVEYNLDTSDPDAI